MRLYFQITMIIRRLLQAVLTVFALIMLVLAPCTPVFVIMGLLLGFVFVSEVWNPDQEKKNEIWARRTFAYRLLRFYLRPKVWKKGFKRFLAI